MKQFQSFNFKLIVIDTLMQKGHFRKEMDNLKAQYWSDDEIDYEPIPEIEDYLTELDLPQELMNEITSIEFDGGKQIYQDIIPLWDGEDDYFDIDNLADITLLPNLEAINVISMLTAIDVEPILLLPNLKKVSWYEAANDENMACKLRAKGIIITP